MVFLFSPLFSMPRLFFVRYKVETNTIRTSNVTLDRTQSALTWQKQTNKKQTNKKAVHWTPESREGKADKKHWYTTVSAVRRRTDFKQIVSAYPHGWNSSSGRFRPFRSTYSVYVPNGRTVSANHCAPAASTDVKQRPQVTRDGSQLTLEWRSDGIWYSACFDPSLSAVSCDSPCVAQGPVRPHKVPTVFWNRTGEATHVLI